jgi:GntR family transcriptional regulator / MocR family aminotransferase
MERTRTSSGPELLVDLRRDDPEPLHRQLERALRDAIRTGRLAPAAVLPSTRGLAAQLDVSRGIVVEAFEQLIAEGYLVARPGGATRVARTTAAAGPRRVEPTATHIAFDFRPGRPDLDLFPRLTWARSVRHVLDTMPSVRFAYPDGHGTPELCRTIAAYLDRARGTVADPADVIVCAGFAQGLGLAAQVLRASGARRIAVEDPSDPEYRAVIRASGLDVVAIPVDGSGMRVDLLAATDAGAVLVTAAHQYPVGGVLPADRRAALIDWAERRNAIVIEDDYDAEFRYDREPIGAIQGLSPDHVIYSGSASKILAPGLRLGWLVVPNRLVPSLAAAKLAADMGAPVLDQLTLADVIERGELDRHLRRMRPIYRRRRDALLEALARHLPTFRPVGASAGLHVLTWLPADIDEARIFEAARGEGIALNALAPRWLSYGPGGLIFGYGGIVEEAIDDGIRRLAEVVAAAPLRAR